MDAVARDDESDKNEKRILFIGNSYTRPLRSMMPTVLAGSPYSGSTLKFVTPGGCTLQRHLDNLETVQLIQSGKWDYVVLQEQSQSPAMNSTKAAFLRAAEELCEMIEDAGAVPVFYMTWGRRDGDRHNKSINPDYETMQEKLTDSYEKAARKNDALLAPVGEVWAEIRDQHEELGMALYRKDGSHPSSEGAYLIACVFYRLFFDDRLESVGLCGDVSEKDAQLIRDAVLDVKISR